MKAHDKDLRKAPQIYLRAVKMTEGNEVTRTYDPDVIFDEVKRHYTEKFFEPDDLCRQNEAKITEIYKSQFT